MLVGTVDNPLYESYLTSAKASSSTTISITSPPATTDATLTATTPRGATYASSPTSFSIFGAPTAAAATGTTAATTTGVGYGHKTGPNGKHVMQLVAHASLDVVEDVQWTNGAMFVPLSLSLSLWRACLSLTLFRDSIGDRYLKSIDKFHEWTVSVWLTPGGNLESPARIRRKRGRKTHELPVSGPSPPTGVKLILLHELKNDEGIRFFFQETWENYVKVNTLSLEARSKHIVEC